MILEKPAHSLPGKEPPEKPKLKSIDGQGKWWNHCKGWPNQSRMALLGNRGTRFHRPIRLAVKNKNKKTKPWLEIGSN